MTVNAQKCYGPVVNNLPIKFLPFKIVYNNAIYFDNHNSELDKYENLIIYDVTGKVRKSFKKINKSIHCSDLESGIYFYSFKSINGYEAGRFIISR